MRQHEIELSGLDGSNLLGFLAALGTHRILSTREPGIRLSWRDSGIWTPVIHSAEYESAEQLIEALVPLVYGEQTAAQAWSIGKNLTLKCVEYREVLLRAVQNSYSGARLETDYLCSFGSEAVVSGPKKDQMSDTEFRTMSGAGHQHFLAFMIELAANTEPDHLSRALFQPWDYSDDRPSMRWDPADYRPHALRADDPSSDPIRTMRGANRLAVEALPLFPTAPAGRKLATVGFQDREGETEIAWPIWEEPLDLGSVGSLLNLAELQATDPNGLQARGIRQVYRAKRFTEGKYRNFSPAIELI